MANPAKRHATYEDLLAVPEHLVAELIHGELYTYPRPALPHARAASRLGIDLGGPFDRGKGGPADGSSLTSPSSTFGAMRSYRISQDGDASASPKCPPRRPSSLRPTGC